MATVKTHNRRRVQLPSAKPGQEFALLIWPEDRLQYTARYSSMNSWAVSRVTMRIFGPLLLAVLLFCSNGCMTGTIVNHARGTWQGPFISGNVSRDQNGKPVQAEDPNPAYYALVPLTVPFDIATSPFQLVFWLVGKYGSFQT